MNTPLNDKQDKLRELFQFIVDSLKVTQVELAKWTLISRPLINRFLNAKDADGTQKLPIKREGLIRFCEELTSEALDEGQAKLSRADSSSENSTEIDTAKLRQLFGEIGVDELLETAGLLPKNTQIIRVTPERFVSVAQIAALFELLTLEELLATTQGIVSIISPKLFPQSEDLESDALSNLIQSLKQPYQSEAPATSTDYRWKSHPILGVKRRLTIVDKLEKASMRLSAGGKTKFTQQEAISLFLSIAIKEQIPNHLNNLHIRVQKLEVKSLSHTITREDAENEKYVDVYERLLDCVYTEECKLKNPHYQERDQCKYEVVKHESIDWFDPVRMATITCSFGMDEGVGNCESIKWAYNSSNTILENAISACGLNLGLNEDGGLAHVITNTKALDGSVNSLVEASVIIGNKQEQYQGIWVDRDLTITILQALVCAAKQWLGEQVCRGELNLLIYVSACKSISELRQQIYSIGKKFQQFEFIDCERQDEYQEIFSNDKNFEQLRVSLQEIAKNARSELKKIPNTQVYFLLRFNLYRCYFLAKIMLLRFENFQGNISNVKQLISEIENVLEEDDIVKAQLNPIQALLQTERILYELSVGSVSEFIDNTKRNSWLKLEQWREKIHVAIKPETVYKDPGLDVYHALSEIYGNCARVEFYFSDDPEVLENAADNFLRAAHYALRIGYKQRASRWFALAGRVWVRLNNEELSKQALNLAKKLALANLTSWHYFNFRKAVCSEISLLEGEILLSTLR